MQLFKKTNIDFMKARRLWYTISSLVILAGFVSIAIKGIDLGIDFQGGTELVLAFEQKPDVANLRAALGTVGMGQSEIKFYGTERNVLIRTPLQGAGTTTGDKIKNVIRKQLPDLRFEVLKEAALIGPKIGEELRKDALYAIIASLLAIMSYIAIRFKFIYGIGAVIALFHDVLVALGVLSVIDGVFPFLNVEISQEVVAAFLTLVGISVNDTVVVFDRIRENLKIYRSLSLGEVINRSLNDALSRTIITQGTVLLVLVVLLFFGGEVTRGFAFTLTVGTIAGTYSSIYIASAIVLDWSLRKKKMA